MTLARGDRCFIDANILIYLRVTTSTFHVAAVAAVDGYTLAGVVIWISRQVLREFLSAATRGPNPLLTPAEAIAAVNGFLSRYLLAEDGADVTAELLALLARVPCGGKQVHDANIAATMIARHVPNILTNNPGDFTRFAPPITVIPLTTALNWLPPPPAPPLPGVP